MADRPADNTREAFLQRLRGELIRAMNGNTITAADAWDILREWDRALAERRSAEPTEEGIPPDSFWREVPCGHPQDPQAWHAPDGHFVCHCGWGLDPEDGLAVEGAPGPVVPCGKCGCCVALGTNFNPSEGPGEQAGTEARSVGLHQPHPVQEKPGMGLPLSANQGHGAEPTEDTLAEAEERVRREYLAAARKAVEERDALKAALIRAAREAAGGNERTYDRLTEILWAETKCPRCGHDHHSPYACVMDGCGDCPGTQLHSYRPLRVSSPNASETT